MKRNKRARSSNTRSISRLLALALVPAGIILTLAFMTSGESGSAIATDPTALPGESTPPPTVSLPVSGTARATATGTPAPIATASVPEATVRVPATAIPSPTTPVTPTARAATAAPLNTATQTAKPTTVPLATGPLGPAPLARLVIPSIAVDSAIEVKSLSSEGVMDSPSGPAIVTWYDFSSRPVDDGNAVFAGHLDYAGYGPAVFWRLGELRAGDIIEVVHEDGVIVRYSVTLIQPFQATDDATSIVASTGVASITIITCEGTFDQVNRVYHERLVVTGIRID